MATRATQVVKTVIIEIGSSTRATQVVKVVVATVYPTGGNTGLRTMGVGS